MAKRQGFVVRDNLTVESIIVDIPFSYGNKDSVSRNIETLHEKLSIVTGLDSSSIFEVSTASDSFTGRLLSPFNLTIGFGEYPLESYYQSTKVFQYGNAPEEVKSESPSNAKRLVKELGLGKLVRFKDSQGYTWDAKEGIAFFDKLYCQSIFSKYADVPVDNNKILFTDIYANPDKSINCNARAVALASVMSRKRETRFCNLPKEEWIEYHNSIVKG